MGNAQKLKENRRIALKLEQDNVKKVKMKLEMMKELKVDLEDVFDKIEALVDSLWNKLRREVLGEDDEPIYLSHELAEYTATIGHMDKTTF